MTRMHVKIDMFMRQHVANDMIRTNTRPDTIYPDFEDVSLAKHAARRLGHYASTLLCSRLSTLLFEVYFAQQRLHLANTLEETRLLKSLSQLRCLEWSEDTISETFKTDCMYEAARSLLLGHFDTDAVFAAQMLYDIQQQVDPQNIPLEDILEELSLDYLQLYEKYDVEWINESLDGNRSTRVKRMHDQYQLLRHNVHSTGNLQETLERWEHATPRQHTVRRFQLLRHVPLLIGQLVAQYHEQFQDTFLDIANDRGHILAAIHLYNAAKKSTALPPETRWDDMEWVIDNQCALYIFGGSPADTNSVYLEQFCDAYGLDHSKFLIGHEPAKVEQVKNDIHLTDGFPRRLDSCAKYVRACSDLKRLHKSNPSMWRLQMMQAFADSQLGSLSAHGSPHSIGMLIAAKETYESDEEALSFDIFAFHMICVKLLSSIHRACLGDAPDDYPDIRYDGQEGLNTTVAELLRDLLDCPRHHARMWPKAVRLLSDVIEQEGSTCSDMAFERMKMTTLDSISMDSDDTRSDTMSAGTAVGTPPPEFLEVDDAESDVEVSDTSKPRIAEDVVEFHAPSKRLKLDPARSPSPAESEDVQHQHQQVVNDILNMTVEKLPDGSGLLLASNGTVLGSWPSHDVESQTEK